MRQVFFQEKSGIPPGGPYDEIVPFWRGGGHSNFSDAIPRPDNHGLYNEMHEEVTPALEGEHDILPPPQNVSDGLALELSGRHTRFGWSREPRVEDLDAVEAPPDHTPGELPADRLDFG